MEVGTNVGIESVGPRPMREVVGEVRQAADLGLRSVWWAERPNIDSLIGIAASALAVPRVRLGTAAVSVYGRHALHLASQALTLQAVADNRLTLGIALGQQRRLEESLGVEFSRPATYMGEFLSALMPLLRGEPVDVAGESLRVRGHVRTPGVTPPRVLVGTASPTILALAGELADGVIAIWSGARTLGSYIVPRVVAAAEHGGRPHPTIAVSLPVCVTADERATRAAISTAFGGVRAMSHFRRLLDIEGSTGVGDIAVVGAEAQVEQQLVRLRDLGVSEFIAVPFGTSAQVAHTLEFLGDRSPVLAA